MEWCHKDGGSQGSVPQPPLPRGFSQGFQVVFPPHFSLSGKIVIKKVQRFLRATREESAAWIAPVHNWSKSNPKPGSLRGQIEINLNNISLKH